MKIGLRTNMCIKVRRKLFQMLSIGIGTVSSIIHGLDYHRVAVVDSTPANWWAENYVWFYHYSVWCVTNKKVVFLHQIVADDESWYYHYESKSKSLSMQAQSSKAPTFCRRSNSEHVFLLPQCASLRYVNTL